ncbi:MAG: OmpA family protein, partial [Deltaproteobacteria bacterium]|nr:OmpA family protein [Deltaproteobacteria bacterium]
VGQDGAGFEYPFSRRWVARRDLGRTHQYETMTGDFWAAGLGIGWRSVPDVEPLPAPIEPLPPPLPEPEPPPVVVTPTDSDGDGLIDPDDKCPQEPGPADNGGCPWPDKDGDKIPDKDDKCVKVAGLSPHGCPDTDEDGLADHVDSCPLLPGPEPTGCPSSDRDGDTVLDDVDQCPDVPGDPPKGCPKKILVVKHEDRIEIKQQINFETGKAKIVGATSVDILDQVAAVLRSNPNIKVVVEGHTDDRGPADFNLQLSDSRAHAVRDALLERGIDPARLEAIGYGLSKPIASNRSASGRAANRRSEFKILGGEAATPKPAESKPTPMVSKPAAPDPKFFHLTLKKPQSLREIAQALWKGDTHVGLLVEHTPEAGGAEAKVPAGSVVKFPRTVEYTVQ